MPPDRASEPRRVLIVDDDQAFVHELSARLVARGYEVSSATEPRDLIAALSDCPAAVAMVDARAAQALGAGVIVQLREARPDLLCIAMMRGADMAAAIEAFRGGAHDFFDKSCPPEEIFAIVERSFRRSQMVQMSEEGYEALRRARDDAEAANKAKSEFLATMSHELRTPLNAIIGFSELMMRGVLGPVGNDNYLSYIKDIHLSGRHLLDIINDILEFSKAEAGKLELLECEVDVGEVVAALLRLIGPKARDAGLVLRERLPQRLSRLWCDERKLKQMLLNLLSNAVKFTPAGGAIELEAAESPAGLTLTVRDTGIGIAKSDLGRVMQPFVQVENSLSRSHEGTGLGLTLVKSMAEIHDGSLTLESELGAGTIARLSFPPDRVMPSPDRVMPAPDRARAANQ
jgi:signal transduction histidine kinase